MSCCMLRILVESVCVFWVVAVYSLLLVKLFIKILEKYECKEEDSDCEDQ